jgi:O-antigen/teichoic acid export membrane protein
MDFDKDRSISKFLSNDFVPLVAKVISADVVTKLVMVMLNVLIVMYMQEDDFQNYIFALTFAIFLVSIISTFTNTSIVTSDFTKDDVSIILAAQVAIVVLVFAVVFPINKSFSGLFDWAFFFAMSQILFLHNQTFFQRKLQFSSVYKLEAVRAGAIVVGLFCTWYFVREFNASSIFAVQSAAAILAVLCFVRETTVFRIANIWTRSINILTVFKNDRHHNLALYFIVLVLVSSLDIFYLKSFGEQEDLGTYGAALRIFAIIYLVLQSIQKVLLPKVSQAESVAEIYRYYGYHRVIATIMTFPLLGLYIFSEWIFGWLVPDKYPNAYMVFEILIISGCLSVWFSPYSSILMKFKDYKFLLVVVIIAMTTNIFGLLLFYDHYGVRGVATMLLISFAIINVSTFMRGLLLLRVNSPESI